MWLVESGLYRDWPYKGVVFLDRSSCFLSHKLDIVLPSEILNLQSPSSDNFEHHGSKGQ